MAAVAGAEVGQVQTRNQIAVDPYLYAGCWSSRWQRRAVRGGQISLCEDLY